MLERGNIPRMGTLLIRDILLIWLLERSRISLQEEHDRMRQKALDRRERLMRPRQEVIQSDRSTGVYKPGRLQVILGSGPQRR